MLARAAHSRRRWALGACALAGVFVLKLLVFTQLHDHPLLQPEAGLDTTAYVTLAKRVLSGDAGLGPGLYYVSPLYVYFLALAYGLTGSFGAVQVVQLALGTVTVGLVFLMGREWGGVRSGWIAGAIATGCGVLTFHEIVLMQSALDPFLTAAALASLTMALRRAGGWFFLAGLCFGIQTLNRPQVLIAALIIVMLLAFARKVKPGALVSAGLVAGMLPVAARNVMVAGQWSLVSSHGGLNFYIGNHANATGLYELIPGVRPEIEGQREDTRRVAESAVGRPLSDAEISEYFLQRGVEWITSNPAAAVQLFARKLVLAIHADHVALPHSYEFFANDERTPLRWLVLNPWIVLPLGLAGLILVRPRGSPNRAAGFGVWAVFVPAYAAALALFFLAERYRLPLLVPLCVSAGMLVDWLLRKITGPEMLTPLQWTRVAGVITVAAVVVNWPLQLSDAREGDRLRMVQHAATRGDAAGVERWASLVVASSTARAEVEERIGRILLRAGRPREALRYLQNAGAGGGHGVELRADLAEAQHLGGDAGGALVTLRSTDWSAATPDVNVRAGRLASALGERNLAVTLLKRATEAEPTRADAWAQLGFALLFSDRPTEAEPALLEAVRLKPSDSVALGGLAVCAARLGRVDEALTRANAALAIDPGDPLARQVRAALGRR